MHAQNFRLLVSLRFPSQQPVELALRQIQQITPFQETLGAVSSRAEEFYTANPLIKSYNQQVAVEAEMAELSEAQFKAFRKAQFVSAAINPFVRFINQIGFILSAVVGGLMVSVLPPLR